jgi:hypothetical protein
MIVRLILFFVVFATSLDAYAQTGSGSSAASGVLAGPLIWGLICFLTRKRAIGGWLLYLYVGLLISGIAILASLAAAHWPSFSPTYWTGAFGYYLLFLVYQVPGHIVGLVLWLFAIRMLFKSQRNSKNLGNFQKLLFATVLFNAIGLIIILVSGAEVLADPDPALDIWFTGVALLMAAYFYRSQRVKMVLGDNYWDHQYLKQLSRTSSTANKKPSTWGV